MARNLKLVRRFIGYCLVPAGILCGFVVAVAHPAPAATPAWGETTTKPLTFDWTPQLAARFPGCRGHLPAGQVPAGFVVQRLDGSFERMPFDQAWRRGHDRGHADDVWVFGQCR